MWACSVLPIHLWWFSCPSIFLSILMIPKQIPKLLAARVKNAMTNSIKLINSSSSFVLYWNVSLVPIFVPISLVNIFKTSAICWALSTRSVYLPDQSPIGWVGAFILLFSWRRNCRKSQINMYLRQRDRDGLLPSTHTHKARVWRRSLDDDDDGDDDGDDDEKQWELNSKWYHQWAIPLIFLSCSWDRDHFCRFCISGLFNLTSLNSSDSQGCQSLVSSYVGILCQLALISFILLLFERNPLITAEALVGLFSPTYSSLVIFLPFDLPFHLDDSQAAP